MNKKKIKEMIRNGKASEVKGYCYFCKKEVDGMSWCFGCKEFICTDCDQNPEAMGIHNAEDHQANQET